MWPRFSHFRRRAWREVAPSIFSLTMCVWAACSVGGGSDGGSETGPVTPFAFIETTSVPIGAVGQAYNQPLTATGGTGSYNWGLAPGSGALPPGLSLSASGNLAGIPTTQGRFPVKVQAVSGGQSDTQDLIISVRPRTERVSVTSNGTQSNSVSFNPAISADGRFIVFGARDAANLVIGDTNGMDDYFVHDRQTGETTRVSVDSMGNQGTNVGIIGNVLEGFRVAISGDGRFVAFNHIAPNLVAGDVPGSLDVFVRDRQIGQTSLVSVDSAGMPLSTTNFNPTISADGRFVAFTALLGTVDHIEVKDRQSGALIQASVDSFGNPGNGSSFNPTISTDGRYVAFQSAATNLVNGDTNNVVDVFVYDSQTVQTTRISVDSNGAQANNASFNPAISADGRIVAFESAATNLVSGDTNILRDIFVHDRQTGQTTRVSVDNLGAQATLGESFNPSITADGRFVAFESNATNLVSGDTNGRRDIIIHDRQTSQANRISVDNSGLQANRESSNAVISADGRFVAFGSAATNLVSGDINGDSPDIYVGARQ